jgi:hypothetical protein
MDNGKKVFISHTKSDKDFARHLAKDIQSLGFSVWLDEWEIRLGDSLIERIEEGIEESQWMIVILSPKSVKSEWVLRELHSGLTKEIGSKKVFVLPVLCKKVTLPNFLRDKFYADFTDSYEYGFGLIKDRLMGEYGSSVSEHWLLIKNPFPDVIAGKYFEDLPMNGLIRSNYSNNTRQALFDYSMMIKNISNEKNGNSKPLPESELWFGKTGRLILRTEGEMIFGDYDWHGLSFAGKIIGKRENNLIYFSWNWKFSSELGKGLFWTDIPNILYGGWWMDYDDVDEAAVRSKLVEIPNKWEFTNVQGLQITADLE